MTFPVAQTVGVHTYTEGMILDDYGDAEPVFTPAKDEMGTQVGVYGISFPTSTEPPLAGHDRLVIDAELWAPPTVSIGPYDLVDLDDGQYQVIGQPQDWGRGPWRWPGGSPGVVVHLRKVSG